MRQEQIVELAVKRISSGEDVERVIWSVFGNVLEIVQRGGDIIRAINDGNGGDYDDLISLCHECKEEIDAEEEEEEDQDGLGEE